MVNFSYYSNIGSLPLSHYICHYILCTILVSFAQYSTLNLFPFQCRFVLLLAGSCCFISYISLLNTYHLPINNNDCKTVWIHFRTLYANFKHFTYWQMLSIFGYHQSYIVILGRHYVVKIWSLDIALSNTTQLAVCEVVTALI